MNQQKPQPRQTNNAQVAQHLQNQGTPPATVIFEENIRGWYAQNVKKLRTLLGSSEKASALVVAALASVQKTPSLAECTIESFALCLLTSAQLNLYPGASQECAYTPFNNNKRGTKEATFVLQYQGLCQLLYRSGMIRDIECEVVCAQDTFEYNRGSNRSLIFKPYDHEAPLDERGEWIGAYSLIRNIYGGQHIRWMNAKEILAIKARSPAARSDQSVWNSKHASDRAEMWKKTVLKGNKYVPRSAEYSIAIARDETEPSDAMIDEKQAHALTEAMRPGARQIAGAQTQALPEPAVGITIPRPQEGEIVFTEEEQRIIPEARAINPRDPTSA